MWEAKYHENTAPACRGPIGSGKGKGTDHTFRRTVQVRFVAACTKGHLQDFPWLEWLFKSAAPDWHPDGISSWIRMRSTGSASLTGVEIAAEERDPNGSIRVLSKRTLAGAFEIDSSSGAPSALAKIGVRCQGHNPVLAVGRRGASPLPGCGHELYPLLRGASNLYFSQVVSSIYIPDIDDQGLSQEILDLLDEHHLKSSMLLAALDSEDGLISGRSARNALKKYFPESAVDPAVFAAAANKHMLKDVLLGEKKIQWFLSQKIKVSLDKKLSKDMIAAAIESHVPDWQIDPSFLLPTLTAYFETGSRESVSGGETRQDTLVESDYRYEEYRILCSDILEGYPKTNLLIRSSPMVEYGEFVQAAFERISLLHKLRETRAFVGYSRIFPDSDLTQEERWGLMAKERKQWLPAVIVRGEGIFLQFREHRLAAWLKEHATVHEGRLSFINRNLDQVRKRRHQEARIVTPKHVLIHTFAHLIINQLVYECGYGSASLRERIYVANGENSMSGVLIYTAAGDSEGTMGGLVSMGKPGDLDTTIGKALEKARWCSSDPVCIESPGQGPDNCNLGACHSCALLPETSCEEQNRLLDRGVVVGTIEQPDIGYFSDFQ